MDLQSVTMRNGIVTYTISKLCVLKATAYLSRDKIRDLYDLTFIRDQYFDQLSPEAKDILISAFEYKNLEQFDYLVRTQHDPLIDTSRLQDRCLAMMDKLGLLLRPASSNEDRDRFHAGIDRQDVRLGSSVRPIAKPANTTIASTVKTDKYGRNKVIYHAKYLTDKWQSYWRQYR